MVITIPAQSQPFRGLRPINLKRDLPQAIKLLELVFGHKLVGNQHNLLSSRIGPNQPAFLWRLNPAANKLALGYVWEEDGRILGNATLLPTRSKNRYLVVNVAVHPDYRRRGIARGLMNALLELVQERDGKTILLQVEQDNATAIDLYQKMDFEIIGSMTTWRCSVSRLVDIDPLGGHLIQPEITGLSKLEWQKAYELDTAYLQEGMNWPEPLPHDAYKSGIWRRLNNSLNGRRKETWVTKDATSRLTGIVGVWSEWGQSHQIILRIHPDWLGQLERPLLAKIIRRLRYLPRRNIRLDHPDDDELVNQLLREANFKPRRTLTHMRLKIQ